MQYLIILYFHPEVGPDPLKNCMHTVFNADLKYCLSDVN
jgi:hypothetical protein